MQSRNNAWQHILRNWILPAGDSLFWQGMMKRFRYLEEAQWWDAERIPEERDKKLRELIHVAYTEVPFYHELFSSAKVKPDDIRTSAISYNTISNDFLE